MSNRRQLKRTREWAERFRQSARDLPAEPAPGVSPIIHEAMRESFAVTADELDRDGDLMVWEIARRWVTAVGVSILVLALLFGLIV